MTIGPVQLLVLGFDKPDFRGEIIDELERLRERRHGARDRRARRLQGSRR
jgi:hypothetical protein